MPQVNEMNWMFNYFQFLFLYFVMVTYIFFFSSSCSTNIKKYSIKFYSYFC